MDMLSKISAEQEDIVGVDITPGSIRIAQLNRQKTGWVLSKLGYKYIQGAEDAYKIRNQPEVYVNHLEQIVSSNKITTQNAAVSIPVSSAIIKVINLPLMSDEELQEAIDTDSLWGNVVQLSESLDDYSVFWKVIKRHPKENMMDILFVASKLSDIENYLDIVRQAGLSPVVVDVRCFSLKNALETCKELTRSTVPVVLLEIGLYENYLLIIKGDSLFISEIYISDQDRKKILENEVDLEDYKQIFGRYAMQIVQILATYQTKYKIQPIKTILVSSVLSKIDDAIGYLNDAIPAVEIKLFDVFADIHVTENLKEKAESEPNATVFSSVMGLATRKLDVFGYYQYVTGANNINLLPGREKIRNVEKTKLFSSWLLVVAAISIIGAGVWSFIDNKKNLDEVDHAMREFYNLDSARTQKQIELNKLNKQKKELEKILNSSKDISSNQNFMYLVLKAVNNAVPLDVSLESISYEGGKNIIMTGYASSDHNILTLVNQLSNEDVIDRASLMTMSVVDSGVNSSSRSNLKSFKVQCLLGKEPQAVSDLEGL